MTTPSQPDPPLEGPPSCPAPVDRLIPFVHVADVEESLRFYALLGFSAGDVLRGEDGRAFWASAATTPPMGMGRTARIMFARASAPVAPEAQAVLFYMYCDDVAALRRHLLASGLHDGGAYNGACGPNNGRRVVFEVTRPDYMKDGEIRIADPDGYCILVGQYE